MTVAGKNEEIEKKDNVDVATSVNYDTCFIFYLSWFKSICTCYYKKKALRELENLEDCCFFLKMNTLNGH